MSLMFRGHVFRDTAECACCTDAKRVVVTDPTSTGKLRKTFRAALGMHWNQLRVITTEMLVKKDILSIKGAGLTQAHSPEITGAGSKIDIFQRWFDLALGNAVLQKDGAFMRKYLDEAFGIGTSFGQVQAKTQATNTKSGHRKDALFTLARVELQGIIEAVSQQAVRAVSEGLLNASTPLEINRRVLNLIETVGRNRSNAMIELLVVRAHAEASLDIYEAAGLMVVGLLPESRAQGVVTDAKAQQKATGLAKDAKRKGPGSRISRTQNPSARTVGRIRRAEANIEALLGEAVNVRTAGDDDVCPTCEDISENGPYTINVARSLIPAHPSCRCVFVPIEDARYSQTELEQMEAEAAIPREGTRKNEVFQVYLKEGRAAAIARAKELGLGPSTAQSWTSQWKRLGTPGGTGSVEVGGVTIAPAPTIPTPWVPRPPNPNPIFRKRVVRTPRPSTPRFGIDPNTYGAAINRTVTNTSGKIEVTGKSRYAGGIKEAVESIPLKHQKELADWGVNVEAKKGGLGGSTNGWYKWNNMNTGRAGYIEIAEEINIAGSKWTTPIKDPKGTTVHELGHALDHKSGWRLNQEIARLVDEDARRMSKDERLWAEYYFSNDKERFAELYRTAYSPGKSAFGMSTTKARRIFARSIARLKEVLPE